MSLNSKFTFVKFLLYIYIYGWWKITFSIAVMFYMPQHWDSCNLGSKRVEFFLLFLNGAWWWYPSYQRRTHQPHPHYLVSCVASWKAVYLRLHLPDVHIFNPTNCKGKFIQATNYILTRFNKVTYVWLLFLGTLRRQSKPDADPQKHMKWINHRSL